MGPLDDKVAIVTGATQAMGAAIARRLAADGAAVMGVGRSVELGRQVAEDIVGRGGTAVFRRADVAEEDDVREAVAGAVDRFGRLDIIVNNAAPMGTGGGRRLIDLPFERFDDPFRVCVHGPLWLARHGIPHMARAGGGAIVNISSGAAVRGQRFNGGYGPAKAALEALGRILAVEHGDDNIRVNTVRLGAVRVPRNADDHDSHLELVREVRMLPRHGSPDDVAAMVAFLAGPDSGWITGEVFVVDGGSAAKHRGVNWAAVHGAGAAPPPDPTGT
jgi:NAD(P)-dependent dehydrogenase (short-subunit alcohol dehydrogenase family)